MGVGLHDTVGVLNAALAIFNSWVDATPMLLLGGAGPADSVVRRPWIDWIHTSHDASRPIGDMLVWAENPTSLAATLEALRRAHQRATSTPAGPAYVGLDLALQEARVGRTPPIRGPLEAWTVRADADAIGRAAEAIGRARRPLIVTDRPLRDAARQHLLRLAELAAIPMVELEGAANVPIGHALDLTPDRARAIDGADLHLLVDVRDPGLLAIRRGRRRPIAIDISPAPLRNATWLVDDSNTGDPLRLAGDTGATLQALADAIQPTAPACAVADRRGSAASAGAAGRRPARQGRHRACDRGLGRRATRHRRTWVPRRPCTAGIRLHQPRAVRGPVRGRRAGLRASGLDRRGSRAARQRAHSRSGSRRTATRCIFPRPSGRRPTSGSPCC